MSMRKWAGEENIDLKMIKLPGDICLAEYALINEEGFVNLLEHINRQSRYIFDFTEINTIIDRYNEKMILEYYKRIAMTNRSKYVRW